MSTNQYLSLKITDKKLAEKIQKYCEVNNVKYVDLAKIAFQAFFDNPDNEFMCMTKEELISIIKSQIVGGMNYGIKKD